MFPCDHVETDPACRFHTAPRTWWQRRRADKLRGVPCYRCARHATYERNRAALQREVLLTELMKQLRDLQTSTEQAYADKPTIRNAWVIRGYKLAISDAMRVLGTVGTADRPVFYNQEK